MKGLFFQRTEVIPMWNVVGGREAANIQKKSVSGYRLKKVMLASIESIRLLSEFLWEPPQKSTAVP